MNLVRELQEFLTTWVDFHLSDFLVHYYIAFTTVIHFKCQFVYKMASESVIQKRIKQLTKFLREKSKYLF